jgi:hypothetical protein
MFGASFIQCMNVKQGLVFEWNSIYLEAGYPDWLRPSNKFVENSTKITYLKITGYRIKYSAVLSLLELQIKPDRKV